MDWYRATVLTTFALTALGAVLAALSVPHAALIVVGLALVVGIPVIRYYTGRAVPGHDSRAVVRARQVEFLTRSRRVSRMGLVVMVVCFWLSVAFRVLEPEPVIGAVLLVAAIPVAILAWRVIGTRLDRIIARLTATEPAGE